MKHSPFGIQPLFLYQRASSHRSSPFPFVLKLVKPIQTAPRQAVQAQACFGRCCVFVLSNLKDGRGIQTRWRRAITKHAATRKEETTETIVGGCGVGEWHVHHGCTTSSFDMNHGTIRQLGFYSISRSRRTLRSEINWLI